MAEKYLSPEDPQVRETLVGLARSVAPGLGRNQLAHGSFFVNVDPHTELWMPDSTEVPGLALAPGSSAILGISPGNALNPQAIISNLLSVDKWLNIAKDAHDTEPSGVRMRSLAALAIVQFDGSSLLEVRKTVDTLPLEGNASARIQEITRPVTPALLQHLARTAEHMLHRVSS